MSKLSQETIDKIKAEAEKYLDGKKTGLWKNYDAKGKLSRMKNY